MATQFLAGHPHWILALGNDELIAQLAFFFVAMALHFLVNDFGLREHYKESYAFPGRWLFAAAVLVGWGIGFASQLPEQVISLLIAFIGGGTILNVLKEELPEERESKFSAFLMGSLIYGAVLIAVKAIG